MKKSVVLRLQWSGIIPLHHLLPITTSGGDGLLSLAFPFILSGHTTMVITGIVLTAAIMVGITDKRGGIQEQYKRILWTRRSGRFVQICLFRFFLDLLTVPNDHYRTWGLIRYPFGHTAKKYKPHACKPVRPHHNDIHRIFIEERQYFS